jgi:fumarylpyruvate hydrolase
VRRVFCVGRNYAAHSREMGGDPDREEPFFFMKPADALVSGGADTPYPPATSDLHHEVEMVVALGQGGANIAEADALGHIFGYAAGVDLTRRDLQAIAKTQARPWDMAKGFDASGPIGLIAPASRVGHPETAAITLAVNGRTRQASDISHMIWSVPETIAYLSKLVTLAAGDLIFTGTPEGVAAVVRGDEMTAEIAGIGTMTTKLI